MLIISVAEALGLIFPGHPVSAIIAVILSLCLWHACVLLVICDRGVDNDVSF